MTIELPEIPAGRAAPFELIEHRKHMQAAVEAGAFRTEEPVIETTVAGLRALRFRPKGARRGLLMLLHGGGFRMGHPEFESAFAEALAARCDVEVIVPQYRLAPEGPFPAGLADAMAALEALAYEAGDERVLVGGDSAGAGLAASLGVLASAQGHPRIDGLVLLSPWLDLRVCAGTFAANAATDPMFSKVAANLAAELYLQGSEPTHPLASPLLAEIAAYPPCLVSVGTGEVLYDDSRLFHAKLLAAGMQSTLCAVEGMEHVAVVRSLTMTGAPETFAAVVAFVEAILATPRHRQP